MAAAYLFHVVSNHAFVDGNKRTGLLCALVFLDLNGVSLDQDSQALYDVTMAVAVAEGRADKARVAETLRAVSAAVTDLR
jgi:death on curing protein